MTNPALQLPERIVRFITARQEQGGVSAVLLYGSYARGTEHEKSDVDIIFIVDEGFKSVYVVHEGLDYEVLETTRSNILDYWQKNLDVDRHWYLWKDVKVLYDRDGDGADVTKRARALVGKRQAWSSDQIQNRRLIMQARFQKIQYLSQEDPATAVMLLVEFVQTLTKGWFITRGQFVPSTKELLAILANECPEFEGLLRGFHLSSTAASAQFDQVQSMLKIVYG